MQPTPSDIPMASGPPSGEPQQRANDLPVADSTTYMICVVPVMPLRATPFDSSEMVSQLLFGEAVEVLGTGRPGWVHIRNQFDQYEGWAASNQLTVISAALYQEPTEAYTSEWSAAVSVNGRPMHLPLGSFLKKMTGGKMRWDLLETTYSGDPIYPPVNEPVTGKTIRLLALQYLNTPYLWGGRSTFGIDCSGFVQSVFRLLGKALPRDASQQAGCGQQLEQDAPLRPGDLAFFQNPGQTDISHVGIVLSESEIIHASGQVRMDPLDERGIRRVETGVYTHERVMIRRIS